MPGKTSTRHAMRRSEGMQSAITKMPARLDFKRNLKCAISLGVFVWTCAGDLFLQLFGKKHKGRCVVLYYHSIPPEERARFVDQLEILLRHAIPIVVGDRNQWEPGKQYAGVTFDDGFENFIDTALPEMAKRNIPSTVFIIADAVGKAFGPQGKSENVMSVEQIRSLPANLVTIGSHTSSHPFLPLLLGEDSRREIVRSRSQIEEMIDRKVLLFSFPFGGYDQKLVSICRDAGYQRVFTTLPSFALDDPEEFVVGRVRVDPTDSPLEFRLKLAGAYRWLPHAFAMKRKLVSGRATRKVLDHISTIDASGGRQSIIQDPGRR